MNGKFCLVIEVDFKRAIILNDDTLTNYWQRNQFIQLLSFGFLGSEQRPVE